MLDLLALCPKLANDGPDATLVYRTHRETHGATVVDFIKTVPRRRHLCLEEGTQSAWLYEVLKPHVDEIVVTRVERKRGPRRPKNDEKDALARANDLRAGTVLAVYKERGSFSKLRSLVDAHAMISADRVRSQNRLKALLRSPGGCCARQVGLQPAPARDMAWEVAVPVPAERGAAVREGTVWASSKSRRTSSWSRSRTGMRSRVCSRPAPGLGELRVARLMAVVVCAGGLRGGALVV